MDKKVIESIYTVTKPCYKVSEEVRRHMITICSEHQGCVTCPLNYGNICVDIHHVCPEESRFKGEFASYFQVTRIFKRIEEELQKSSED